MKDTKATDVTQQKKASEEEDDDVSLAESLDVVCDKDQSEAMEDVVLEEVIHPLSITEDTSDAIAEVAMESIHEMAGEDTAENINASLKGEEEEEESEIHERQTRRDDTSSEVAFEDKFNVSNVVDEEEQIKSTSMVGLDDQTDADVHSGAFGEEETVENVAVSDVFGEEEPVKLANSATNKTDEDQTKTGGTSSEAEIKEESNESTVSNVEEKTLKPTMNKEPDETGVVGDEGPVKLPDTVIRSDTNDSDEDHSNTKTGDIFSDATTKEQPVVSNVELKPLAPESTDEDQSETLSETLFKVESVDVPPLADEQKPIISTHVPTKDEEETKMEAYIETVDQEAATSESSPGAHDGVMDKGEGKRVIIEVKDDQVEKATKKDNGEDDVIQSDDENNNNNDRKTPPIKRDHVMRRATAKEPDDQEDELREDNDKGINMIISSYEIWKQLFHLLKKQEVIRVL